MQNSFVEGMAITNAKRSTMHATSENSKLVNFLTVTFFAA